MISYQHTTVPLVLAVAGETACSTLVKLACFGTGDVPYIICLDRPTRSVVLSIRGTQSLADGATDLLAYPHPLHHWLPDCYREVPHHHICCPHAVICHCHIHMYLTDVTS